MTASSSSAQRSTTLVVALVVAVPFASVTLAAWLDDAASSTSSSDAALGLTALTGGLVVGFFTVSLVRAAATTVCAVSAALGRSLPRDLTLLVGAELSTVAPFCAPPVARLILVPSSVGRRGPPSQLR